MSIPIHILFPPSTQPVIPKTPKTAAKPLDANYIFQSVRELEDYIKNDTAVFVGQVVVVDRDVYIITETGEKPGYHKLQTEQSRIIIDKGKRTMKNNIPEVGRTYAFFDDGKTGFSRRYKATVLDIIPSNVVEELFPELYYSWQREIRCTPDLYANSTDYFVECSMPKYEDDHLVYFVRDTSDGWFSIDYPHGWMSGLLDVDGEYSKKNDIPPVDEWVAGRDCLEG